MKQHINSFVSWGLIVGLILLTCSCQMHAQEEKTKEERSLRAVWVTTVYQLDFPRITSRDPIAIKLQWDELLKEIKKKGFNAIFFQVRPSGDAFYTSAFAPWSRFLTGEEGSAPFDNFDPLKYFIESAHDQNVELHAWLNPFRAAINNDSTTVHDQSHILIQKPEWCYQYGKRAYLDPGLPEVRRFLLQSINELVENYELDGIHFDDYFYPYPIPGVSIPDTLSYSRLGGSFFDKSDWRRNNINEFIDATHQLIKQKKPYLRFGVSPFGVWRNEYEDQRGSKTKAIISSYDDLYTDVLEWIDKKWIDYVAPQLYWEIGNENADYEILLNWWNEYAKDRQLLIGHALYKVDTAAGNAWALPNEIPLQLKMSKDASQVVGNAFFRANYLLKGILGIGDTIANLQKNLILPPVIETQLALDIQNVNFRKPRWTKMGVELCWRMPETGALPYYYAIYRFEGPNAEKDLKKGEVIHLSNWNAHEKAFCFYDKTIKQNQYYTYQVIGLDRYHRLGQRSNEWSILKTEGKFTVDSEL
ncbi:MAG: family 10 glycosylhydrolase [Bacteroidota bacterium]